MPKLEHERKRIPLQIQDVINPAAYAEEQRNLDQIVTPAGKLAYSLDVIPIPYMQRALQMDHSTMTHFILSGEEIPQDQREPIDLIYAYLRILERECDGDKEKMLRKLEEANTDLRKDPRNNTSVDERSPIQAIIDRDFEQLLFVAEMSSQEAHEDEPQDEPDEEI